MKRLAILLLLALALPSAAFWENKTATLKEATLLEKKKNKTVRWVEFKRNRKVPFVLSSKCSVQWEIISEKEGKVSLFLKDAQIASFNVKKGRNEIKKYLEAGSYSIAVSADARGKYFQWKHRNLDGIVPVGGGYPSYISVRKQQYTYFRVGGDTVPELQIKGPTTAYIYVRADIARGKKTERLEFLVKENDSTLIHQDLTIPRSSKAVFVGDTTKTPGDAIVLTLKVPAGIHKYKVFFKKGHGVIKFYRNEPKNLKKNVVGENSPARTIRKDRFSLLSKTPDLGTV